MSVEKLMIPLSGITNAGHVTAVIGIKSLVCCVL